MTSLTLFTPRSDDVTGRVLPDTTVLDVLQSCFRMAFEPQLGALFLAEPSFNSPHLIEPSFNRALF